MSNYTPAVKKTFRKTANQSETDLILKIYRKKLSLHNKGKGPKPDLNELISKSRVKDFGFDWSRQLKSPDSKPSSKFLVGRTITFPKNLSLSFTEEIKSGAGFYLIEFPSGVKFGISKNIKSRIADYQKPWCHTYVQCQFIYLEYRLARDIETVLIRHYETYASPGTKEFLAGKTLQELREKVSSLVEYSQKYE